MIPEIKKPEITKKNINAYEAAKRVKRKAVKANN
jgi:hypothetical protein